MLFSKAIKLDKDYQVKIGVRELTKLDQLGINISASTQNTTNLIKILHTSLKRNKDYDMTEDQLIDFIDESETITFSNIIDVIIDAFNKGLNKTEEAKEESSEEEGKPKNS